MPIGVEYEQIMLVPGVAAGVDDPPLLETDFSGGAVGGVDDGGADAVFGAGADALT